MSETNLVSEESNSATQNNTKNQDFKFLSEGVSIVILTALLYLIAYNYYIGFYSFFVGNFDGRVGVLDYYRNPSIFTDLSLYKLITLSYKVALPVLGSISSACLLLLFIKKNDRFLRTAKVFKYTLAILLMSIILFLLSAIKLRLDFNHELFTVIYTLGFFPTLIIFALEIVVPFFEGSNEKGIYNRVKQGQKSLYTNNILYIAFKKYPIFFILFAIFGTILPLSTQLGYMDGVNKVEYFVINYNEKSYVVVDTNDDNYIVVPYEINTKTFEPKFNLIKIETIAEKGIVVKCEEIGPLHIKP